MDYIELSVCIEQFIPLSFPLKMTSGRTLSTYLIFRTHLIELTFLAFWDSCSHPLMYRKCHLTHLYQVVYIAMYDEQLGVSFELSKRTCCSTCPCTIRYLSLRQDLRRKTDGGIVGVLIVLFSTESRSTDMDAISFSCTSYRDTKIKSLRSTPPCGVLLLPSFPSVTWHQHVQQHDEV
jgi:hypothetical protein